MSGIAGLFNLDGRPADPRLVRRMLGAIATRGPDASRVWSSGAIGLGHCLLATTPESVGEVQPHVALDGGLAIVFDGRLDNRRELAEAFARARVARAADCDAAFVLAAYQCWGLDCAARLLGDFAFVVWDREQRRLFCARDVMAQKPFYYHHSGNLFLFASEPQALLKHPAVSRAPNEGMIGEYLSVITSVADTLLADVQRLPRAHRIAVSPGEFRLDQYWDIDPARTVRYRTVDDYCEHLRALLRQVVGDRLRSGAPTGVMLSGGVDSSSIMATAMELRRSGDVTEAFSLVAPGGPLDEKAFIDRTVATAGCASHQYTCDALPLEAYRTATRRRADLASSPSARLMDSVKHGAQQRGVRVLLSGIGGDEWFGGSTYHSADLFRTLRWGALGSYVRAVSRGSDGESLRHVLKATTWPLLPRSVRRRIKSRIGRNGVPRWIRRDFAERIALADRLYPTDPDKAFPTVAQRTIYRDMTSGGTIQCIEDEERLTADCGIELRSPFSDRRIMEFGLAIPEELRWRDGTRKFVLREAMRGRLPDEVRLRPTSPESSFVFMPTLRALADDGLFLRPAIEREGWVNAGDARSSTDRILARHASGDPDYTTDVWPMWLMAAVELWMREVADRDPAGNDEEEACDEMRTALTIRT